MSTKSTSDPSPNDGIVKNAFKILLSIALLFTFVK
jgi:hypothetical protein